jgi:ADP-ribose pyrophosphatase YjhB (NUDIX family)
MKTLAVLRDLDIASDIPAPEHYEERTAARAVVYDAEGNVGLMYSTVHNYHKLPGGGVEAGEDLVTALKREAKEEIGCEIGDIVELGYVEEFRNKIALHQHSFCYTARVVGEKGEPALEEGEIAEGFITVWMPLDTAIETLTREMGNDVYLARFMTRRELAFLSAAKESTL